MRIDSRLRRAVRFRCRRRPTTNFTRPRTRSSNPVLSSGESTNHQFLGGGAGNDRTGTAQRSYVLHIKILQQFLVDDGFDRSGHGSRWKRSGHGEPLTSVNRKDASGAEFIGRIRRGRGVMADITQTTQPSIAAPKIRAGVSGTRLKQAVLGLAMIAGIFAAAEYGPAPFRSRRGGRRVISGRET